MVDHKLVYQQEGDSYQRLIDREDYQGNLLPAIQKIIAVDSLHVVDLGSGTGRLARLVQPIAGSVCAFDRSSHMLGVAVDVSKEDPRCSWMNAAADHRAIPLPTSSVDLVLSGWSFCYLVVWEEQNWESELLAGLREIERVLRKGGTVILIETLGTGVVQPQPPEKLVSYFKYLESLGFQRSWIRTDYKFIDLVEAHELVNFFFGAEMLPKVIQDNEPILPECTGIWWYRDFNL
jgi:ubiquinone/menaquinone biosynthesis C-methylase UbiE